MCPSIAILAGGGDGGGGSGKGPGDGDGDNNAGSQSGGEDAEADERGAPDYEKYPECGYASHPVDVVTGRAFTHPITDLELPGPLPLTFERMYSSKMAHRDAGLGFGWGHTFGWEIEVQRRRITVWNEQGVAVDFPMIPQGAEVIGPWGWVLRREAWGFAVDADDGVWHLFSASEQEGKRWRLTAIEDRNRNRISITYDDGRLVEVKDSAGRVIRVVPTREGRIASIQVQNAISQGQWVAFATYEYDERGDLVTATDADGYSAHYAYDEDHRLTADTDRAGLCFHFVYDREGRCVESWGDYPGRRDPSLVETVPRYLHDGVTRAKGIHHCKLVYSADGYTEVVDSTQVRRFFGNKHGTLDKAVEGAGVMTATYDHRGFMLAQKDALGGTTSWDRDARGRVLRETDALGRTTVTSRGPDGLPVEVVDAGGGVTQMARDEHGNLIALVDPLQQSTTLRYDDRGLVLEIAGARGGRLTASYDDHGNRVQVTEPDGATWRYGYDALGRRTVEIDPLGVETRFSYSPRGDLVATHQPSGTTRFSYDGEGHLTQVVDPTGAVTVLTWGGYHKLAARRDPLGHEVRLGYNLEGELVEVCNAAGERHRFEYDPAGRLVAEMTADGRSMRYKNDALGRVLQAIDGTGRKTTLTYDLAGQVVTRELPDGSAHAFEYDALGLLTAAVSPGCECRFERDALGRVVRETQVVGGDEHSVESTWDADDNLVARQTSLGHTLAVERDIAGARLRTILDRGAVLEHTGDLAGRELSRALPGGARIESAFDAEGMLVQRRVLGRSTRRRGVGANEPAWIGPQDDGAIAATSYRYDPNGELIDAWDQALGSTSYEYDPLGQLVRMVPEKARAEVFSYDAAGRVSEAGSGPARAYGPGGRVSRRGDVEYAWDDDGRLVEKRVRHPGSNAVDVWRYEWDGAGMLRSVARPDGVRVDMLYDALARRVQKRVTPKTGAASLTRFVWDGAALVHEIKRTARKGGDPVIEERTYHFEDDDEEPLAQREAGEWLYYVNTPAGAPSRLVNGAGDVACELRAGAWGSLTPLPGARAETPLRLAGQYEDVETGLTYNRHRYYDAELGRFVSPDPSGLEGGLDVYAFAVNAVSGADPDGLAKRGPKKKDPKTGRGGPHNDKIMDRIGELKKKGWTHVAGGTKKEDVIKTPKSKTGRKCRRPDITMKKKNGQLYYENVGLSTPNGDPVSREVNAQDDVEGATGIRPKFTSYGVRKAKPKKKKKK